MLSTLSGGIRTYGPVRARPDDLPLARRGTSQLDDHSLESVAAARSPRTAIPGRGAEEPRCPLRAFALQAGIGILLPFALLRPLAQGSAHVVGAGLSAGGEVRRHLLAVSAIGPLAPERRDGDVYGRDDADGRVLSSRHQLETSRGKRERRLVSPAGQSRKTVVWRCGSSGGAATLLRQVAVISAPLTASKVALGLLGSSCTVRTRPSRLKRMPLSTSVATPFLAGGAADRSTSDSRVTATTTATRAATTASATSVCGDGRSRPSAGEPAERRTAFAPVLDRRHAFELGANRSRYHGCR